LIRDQLFGKACRNVAFLIALTGLVDPRGAGGQIDGDVIGRGIGIQRLDAVGDFVGTCAGQIGQVFVAVAQRPRGFGAETVDAKAQAVKAEIFRFGRTIGGINAAQVFAVQDQVQAGAVPETAGEILWCVIQIQRCLAEAVGGQIGIGAQIVQRAGGGQAGLKLRRIPCGLQFTAGFIRDQIGVESAEIPGINAGMACGQRQALRIPRRGEQKRRLGGQRLPGLRGAIAPFGLRKADGEAAAILREGQTDAARPAL
jgi:hypothetical protein